MGVDEEGGGGWVGGWVVTIDNVSMRVRISDICWGCNMSCDDDVMVVLCDYYYYYYYYDIYLAPKTSAR